jgi:hypothetical protein
MYVNWINLSDHIIPLKVYNSCLKAKKEIEKLKERIDVPIRGARLIRNLKPKKGDKFFSKKINELNWICSGGIEIALFDGKIWDKKKKIPVSSRSVISSKNYFKNELEKLGLSLKDANFDEVYKIEFITSEISLSNGIKHLNKYSSRLVNSLLNKEELKRWNRIDKTLEVKKDGYTNANHFNELFHKN